MCEHAVQQSRFQAPYLDCFLTPTHDLPCSNVCYKNNTIVPYLAEYYIKYQMNRKQQENKSSAKKFYKAIQINFFEHTN